MARGMVLTVSQSVSKPVIEARKKFVALLRAIFLCGSHIAVR
jgi:hypothetical protein